MWAKLEVLPSDQEMLWLPGGYRDSMGDAPTIRFGREEIPVAVGYDDDIRLDDTTTFEKPGVLRMTSALRERLRMPEPLVYQVMRSGGALAAGPVIGLLLGVHTGRYDPRHMQKYSDRLGVYPQVGGLIYAFSPKSVNWENHTAYGLYYNIGTALWEYGCFPLPEVIYRRDFHSDPAVVGRLAEYTGGRLFNSYRFTKYELFNAIRADSRLRMFLPATELSRDFGQMREFMEWYPRVILKPVDLSRGRGICVIEHVGRGYRVSDYRCRFPMVKTFRNDAALKQFFEENPSFFHKYLIQQYLRLAKIGNSCFDIRVVMQKDRRRQWGCSGIECRVSGEGSHLTNISRGGNALTLEDALEQSFGKNYGELPENIHSFCRRFCDYMDTQGGHFAEFGMDIAVDVNKNLWLIEANVFPSFKGIKRIDLKTYLAIRYTPLLYALSLSGFGEDQPEAGG